MKEQQKNIMKNLEIKTLFCAFILILNLNGIYAYDFESKINEGLNSIYAYDLSNAKLILQELDSLKLNNPYFFYYKSKVEYEEGLYKESLNSAKKSLEFDNNNNANWDFLSKNYNYLNNSYKILQNFKKVSNKKIDFFYINAKDSILATEATNILLLADSVFFKLFAYIPNEKIRVEVYPNRDDFITVSTLPKDAVGRNGTIALSKFSRLFFVSPRCLRRGYDWRSTLIHEYIHYIINKISKGKTPIWFHEGLAHHDESLPLGKISSLSVAEKSLIIDAIKNRSLITFKSMSPSLSLLKDANESSTAYAHCAIALDLIIDKGGYPLVLHILKEASKGRNFISIVDSAMQSKLGFENFVKNHIYSLKIKDEEQIEDTQDLISNVLEFNTEIKDDEAFLFKKYVSLAESFMEISRIDAAVVELERAQIKIGKRSPWLMCQIAKLYKRNGEFKKSQDYLFKTIKLYTEYSPVYFELANLEYDGNDLSLTIKYLTELLNLNPFHIPGRKLLMEIWQKMGKSKRFLEERKILELLEGE